MSSHMYGCECWIEWKGRCVNLQLVIPGTNEFDDPNFDRSVTDWETGCYELKDIAAWELANRDWATVLPRPSDALRLEAWGIYVSHTDGDPGDPKWNPPRPSEREVLEILAAGDGKDERWGWDT